jgi:glycosyltransferase involved in cell wall biosynthesis
MACDFHRHYAAMLCGAMDRAGAEVTILTRDHDLEFGGEEGAAEEFVRGAAGTGVAIRTVDGRVRSAAGWRQALRLRRSLRSPGGGYLHLQESVGNDPRLLLAAGVRRRRYALTVHDPVLHPGDAETRWAKSINRRVVRGAALIFVHAEALREELISEQAPPGKIVVVPHGIDPGEVAPLPRTPAVLFFGRVSHYKGIDVLCDAMERVWETIPEATLTIAGQGDVAPHAALGDARVTRIEGHVPEADVAGLIKTASCVALPYRQASQSGVGSRVKPFGRPLVVTNVGGLPELVSDGSGLVVPPEDPARLAEALVSLLGDRSKAESLGAAGAATAEREGSWDLVAERTLEAYERYLPPAG